MGFTAVTISPLNEKLQVIHTSVIFFVIGIKQAGTIGLNILDQISTGFIH